MPPIVLLANGRAGAYLKDPKRFQRLQAILGDAGQCYLTHSLGELAGVVKQLPALRPRAVALDGGDGTYHAALSALAAAFSDTPFPPLIPLRGGTMNVLAGSFGVREAHETLREAQNGTLHALKRTLLCVGPERGFLFGFGLIPRFTALYLQQPGFWHASWVLARISGSSLLRGRFARHLFQPFPVEIRADGQRLDLTQATNISAATVPDLGFGFQPFVLSTQEPGRFHLIAHCLSPAQALRQLWRIRRGAGMAGPTIRQQTCAHLEIRLGFPEPFNMEGENFPPVQSCIVTAGPVVTLLVQRKHS